MANLTKAQIEAEVAAGRLVILRNGDVFTIIDSTAEVPATDQAITDGLTSLEPAAVGSFSEDLTLADGADVVMGTTTGSKIPLLSTQKLGFWGKAPIVQPTSAALVNNVTSGGTANTIANFTDLSTYATDAAAIRNNFYQLSAKVKEISDALRLMGLLG